MQQDGDFQASLSMVTRHCLIRKEGSVGRKGGVPAGKLCVWDVLVEVPMSSKCFILTDCLLGQVKAYCKGV